MYFEISYHAGGSILDRFTVKARKAAIAGIWLGEWPYLPDQSQVIAGIRPAYLRKAIARGLWWISKADGCDVARLDMYRLRDGAPMGSIFARLVTA
jgi:hypothetical protein